MTTMATTHDYAGCRIQVCGLCDAYSDGYSHGKDKAFFEIRAVPDAGHAQDCGCRPCNAVRDSVRAMVGLDQGALQGKYAAAARRLTQTAEPAHLRDCAGPGCGASCTCWCHAVEAESI